MRLIDAKLVAGVVLALAGGCLNNAPNDLIPIPDGGAAPDAARAIDAGLALDADTPDADAPDMTPAYEPSTPASYVGKVKDLLIGEPATDAEVQAVTSDPGALSALIDGWTAKPAFETRAQDFFRNAFQQNSVDVSTLWANSGQSATFEMNTAYKARLERSMMDSFAMSAWNNVVAGQSLANMLTTDTYMLTTAQVVILSYLDEQQVSDELTTTNRLAARNAINAAITFDPASTATYAQAIDATDTAHYMNWPNIETATAKCAPAKTTIAATNGGKYLQLLRYMFGFGTCANPMGNPATINVTFAPAFLDADFTDYHAVKIVQAAATDTTTPVFWDLPTIRTAGSLTLHTTRTGFAGSLAFAANWGTNAGNEGRVTANQMLIVGIGRSINGSSTTVKFPVNSTDADHASDPACSGCHSQLDPMKQFIRQSWTLDYHDQTGADLAAQMAIPANFAIDGVTATGSGIGDLEKILATHPRFALAWTEKLYFWATSRPADETDPELLRVANVFSLSGYNFKTLVRELFSSPLVTYATSTKTTAAAGDTLSIARRDQFCTALSNRLGLTDVCGMTSATPTATQSSIASVASLIAADTYFRAFELPALPTSPDLFFRTSAEAVCSQVAALVVDAGAGSRYVSTNPTPAIADMVSSIMGLTPSDPRNAQAVTILTGHFDTAKGTSGVTATQALRSTFALACLAPSSVIVGL